ncbi:MAG TPA: S8 family serine peptidase [Pirellulaceae bacterium]|nr:S8 family serine peptidase [Pirellulaceae bacterium]
MAKGTFPNWMRKKRVKPLARRSRRRGLFESLESRLLLSVAPLDVEPEIVVGPPVAAGPPAFVQGELLVGFRQGAGEPDIRGIYHAHGLQELERLYQGERPESVRRVSVPAQAAEAVKQALARNPHVEYAELNVVATSLLAPNDPYYSYQWNFQNPHLGGVQSEEAWAVSTGAGVVVAVLDTGVAYANHQDSSGTYYRAPDLAGTHFVAGYDFINNDPHANDDHSHGTHVAGTIAQTTNNSRGVAGMAYDSAVMPVKVLGWDGTGSHSAIASGIKWAADQGAHVINLSLGSASGSRTLRDAVAYAHGKGVTLVAASGNDGVNGVHFPAAYDDYVIAVGATRYDGRLAGYSNYGSSIDIVAPGGDMSVDQNRDGYPDGILQNTFNPSTQDTSQFAYYFFQGTSMATAHVSGAAAQIVSQLLSTSGSVHPDHVRQILESTAVDMGAEGVDMYYGHGILDAGAALQSVVLTNSAPIADDDSAMTLHVAQLEGRARTQRNQWRAEVDIRIADSDGQGVAEATVTGAWSDGRTFSGTTDAAGQMTTASRWMNRSTQTNITLTIGSVAYANWAFDDSNSTSIVVHRDGTTTVSSMLSPAPPLSLADEDSEPMDDQRPDHAHRPDDVPAPPQLDVPSPADEHIPVSVPPAPRWRNPILPLDVINNGRVSPLDALVVINHLNTHGVGPIPDPMPGQSIWHYLDTSGDDVITPMDALLVINYLNRPDASELTVAAAEAESGLPDTENLEMVPDRLAENLERRPEAVRPRTPPDNSSAPPSVPWEQAVRALERVQENVPRQASDAIQAALTEVRDSQPLLAEDHRQDRTEHSRRRDLFDLLPGGELDELLDVVAGSRAPARR